VSRRMMVIVALALAVVLVALVAWIISAGISHSELGGSGNLATATNPALDVRYSYDPAVFTPAPYDERGEYPLQLDAESWSLHGKRIAGLGRALGQAPAPIVYDFVASQHAEMYEDWYKLERTREEYEDATIQGRLAVHCSWTYQRTPESGILPPYMPQAVRESEVIESEGWALFTDRDLFFFYTFGTKPLTDDLRAAVLQVLESMQFNVLGTLPGPAHIPRGSRGEADGDEPGVPGSGMDSQSEKETAPLDGD